MISSTNATNAKSIWAMWNPNLSAGTFSGSHSKFPNMVAVVLDEVAIKGDRYYEPGVIGGWCLDVSRPSPGEEDDFTSREEETGWNGQLTETKESESNRNGGSNDRDGHIDMTFHQKGREEKRMRGRVQELRSGSPAARGTAKSPKLKSQPQNRQ